MTKQVALVTGGSSGMGKDFAKALRKEEFTVYAVARRVEKMQDLEALGVNVLPMDITDEQQIIDCVETIRSVHGGIDLLVNNAGFGMYGSVEETTIADARYQFEVNLFGLASLTQKVLPDMRQKRAGKIINITSIGGKIYTPLGSWYHATKHALEGWSDCLRVELKPFGIDVVIIEPGAIKTEFGEVMDAPMMQRSGKGPYATYAQGLSNALAEQDKPGQSSPPSVITGLLIRAVRATRPKTRYAGGKYAWTLLFIRKWLGDRIFDRAVMGLLK